MPLSRLAGVSNFCSNSLSRFCFDRKHVFFSSHTFQNLLCALFPWFPWLTLFPFPSYFNFYNLTYLESMSPCMTWPYHRRRLWIIVSSVFITTPTLSQRTSINNFPTSLTLHIILIIRRSTPCNLASFATVTNITGLTAKKMWSWHHLRTITCGEYMQIYIHALQGTNSWTGTPHIIFEFLTGLNNHHIQSILTW